MIKKILHRLKRTPKWRKTKYNRIKIGDPIRATNSVDKSKIEGVVVDVKPNYLWIKRDNRHISISTAFTNIEIFR